MNVQHITVISHHANGRGTPFESLHCSYDALLERGVEMHYAWGRDLLGCLRCLGMRYPVIFDGFGSLCHYWGMLLYRLAKGLRIPVAVYWHETAWYLEDSEVALRLAPVFRDRAVRHFHVSRSGVSYLHEKYGIPSEHIYPLLNASAYPDYSIWTNASAIPSLYCLCGVVSNRKGVDLLLEIVKRVVRIQSAAQFLWLGAFRDGYAAHDLQQECCRVGIGPRIIFTGHVEHPIGLLAISQAILLTSRSEGAPKVLMEAAGLGKPTIAFDVDGVREICGPGAVIIPPFDIEAFSDAIIEQRFGDSGDMRLSRRQMCEREFSMDGFADRFVRAAQWWLV